MGTTFALQRFTAIMQLTATPVPQPHLWHADEIDRLCAMLSVGTPLRRIALELGLSQSDIVQKAQKLGRAPRYMR